MVNAVAKLPEPSKSPVPVTSPVNDKVLAVASAEAVAAFPVHEPELPLVLPVTLPVRLPSRSVSYTHLKLPTPPYV